MIYTKRAVPMSNSDQIHSTLPSLTVESGPDALALDLSNALSAYLDEQQIDKVYQAYRFGATAHEGQTRRSGEPYICHPLAVARILSDMRLNCETIIAAILHDVIEDTDVSKQQLAEQFGEEVAELVDGVSKLTQIKFESRVQAQAENFRKMLLAMVEDIRVIIIKLADRLHNMRTLGSVPVEKRQRIARETLEIYAPIANRLGMNMLRIELQDLGFAERYPMRYRVLTESVKKVRGNRREIISKIEEGMVQRLREEGVVERVEGREKHLYSIYQKMKTKRLSFNEVFDVYAFRVVVDSADACYRTLGVVHNLYKPVPGKFKDYIALPKTNGYQGLHTVLFGPYGVPLEVQIRSEDMDKVAESGVAAHWLYKLGESDHSNVSTQADAREWMRGLLEIQKSAGDSVDFIENVKIDLFPDVVYVFTPQGKIMQLTRGATAVDFAYAVHTDIGNTCVAVKINRRLAPLSSPLYNGQTVEILTAASARPNPTWLNFVVTGKARATIRNNLKNLKSDEAEALGLRMLEQSLAGHSMSCSDMDDGLIEEVLKEVKLESLAQLYQDIGLGNHLAPFVARRIADAMDQRHKSGMAARPGSIKSVLSRYIPSWLGGGRGHAHPLAIKGTEGMVMSFARCCYPIPGDSIKGFVSSGRGVVIHRDTCKNIADDHNQSEKFIDVQWEDEAHGDFAVEIRVEVINRLGVLATLAATISEMDANIGNVVIEDRDGKYSSIVFAINVHDRIHLAAVMRRVKSLDMVSRIKRRS